MRKIFSKSYYELEFSTEREISGGIFPQCYSFMKGVDYKAPQSFYNVYESFRKGLFPDFKPRLSGYRFAQGAKPTDFVSDVVFNHPIVTLGVIKGLENLIFSEHRIYPMRVYYRRKPRLYFFPLFIFSRILDYMIWDKSKFYDTRLAFKTNDLDSIYDKRLGDLYFCSLEEYKTHPSRGKEVERFAVTTGFDLSFDYLRLEYFNYKLVSERFIDTVEYYGFTGLEWGRRIEIDVYEK